MEFRLLGPLEVLARGGPVGLGGKQRRTVLAILLVDAGVAVSTDRLIDEIWGESPPAAARKTVQAHVAHLRRMLSRAAENSEVITSTPAGYVLTVDPETIDSRRFEQLTEEAHRLRPTDPAEALDIYEKALGMFRGEPLADVADTAFALRVEASRLEELRLTISEDRLDAMIASGRAQEAAPEAKRLLSQHPLRERTWAMLMLALYRTGRQAEALQAFSTARQTLAQELGLEPSPELRTLEQQILEQDPALEGLALAGMGTRQDLPRGMVTFLLTDIEGSTRLLHQLGDRYPGLLERHREILRQALVDHGGHEMSVEGDSLFAAFATAPEAVAATTAAQQALSNEAWPDGAAVRVRMGLHTGLASPRGGNYVALAVHQTARVAAAGHGGQVLVSEHTVNTLGPDHGFRFRPLGRYRLRDFSQPVRLYQLLGPGLLDEFPAVRALPAEGHNIVPHRTETIGRDEVIDFLASQIVPGGTVTLTGPGGVGKSRLATEVALRIASQWEDGVWLVDLVGVTEPELVPGAVAAAVGAPGRPDTVHWDDLVFHLENRRAAVIMDNCEHLAHSCGELVDSLIAACPGVGVLATSREPLRAASEILWPVEPLAVPTGTRPGPEEVLGAPAGQLFWQRGMAARPGFSVDESNGATVAAICRRVEGIPLLIELAAAHLSAQSPAEILAGLEDQLRFLRSPDTRTASRHRTVQGLLDWSYRLLTSQEQAALRRLSVFATNFSQTTASPAVTDDNLDEGEVPVLLWSLVDCSLVGADLSGTETRYRLLETVRSYARRHLDEQGETETVAVQLSRWFLDRLGPWLPADRLWVSRVGDELENIRSLIPLIPLADQEVAQQIACSIGRYHDATQTFRKGIASLSPLVGALDQATPSRVSLLTTLADLHLRTGEIGLAEQLLDEAELLRQDIGAAEWDDVAVERTRGEIARRKGDLEGAMEIARQALALDISDRGRSRMYNLLGTTSGALGDYAAAYEACSRELELQELLGYEGYIASAHGNLAETALRLGDVAAAARHQKQCLDLGVSQGTPAMVAFSLMVAARVAAWREDWATAASLHSRAEVMLEEIGLALYEDDRRESDALLGRVTDRLGHDGLQRAFDRGRRMSLSEVVQLADGLLDEAARMPTNA